MIFTDYNIADMELSRLYPQFAALPAGDRYMVLEHVQKKYVDNGALGAEPVTVVVAIVGIVVALVSAGIQIAQLVKQARTEKGVERSLAAAKQVREETAGITQEAALIESKTKAEKTKMLTAAIGVAGVAGIVALITFT